MRMPESKLLLKIVFDQWWIRFHSARQTRNDRTAQMPSCAHELASAVQGARSSINRRARSQPALPTTEYTITVDRPASAHGSIPDPITDEGWTSVSRLHRLPAAHGLKVAEPDVLMRGSRLLHFPDTFLKQRP